MGRLPMKIAEARNRDIHLAFDGAPGKVVKQLRRTRRELRDDKGERVDGDALLRERISRAGGAYEDRMYA